MTDVDDFLYHYRIGDKHLATQTNAEEVSDFLAHYGVKGMKWGVRKDRYLKKRSAAKSERREVSAKKYEARASVLQTRISELNSKNPTNPWDKKALANEKSILTLEKRQATKDAKAKRQGKLTSKQKTMLKGAGIAAAVLATYAVYSAVQSGEMNRLATKGLAFIKDQDISWIKNPELAKPDMSVNEIMSSVVSKINPDYGGLGTKQNCRRATFAYEMRRRGFDVEATKTTTAHGQTLLGLFTAIDPSQKAPIATGKLASISKGVTALAKRKLTGNETLLTELADKGGLGLNPIKTSASSRATASSIFRALRDQPNRSRGEVAVSWAFGGGHSIAYEIVNGTPVIFDTQSGKRFLDPSDIVEAYPTAIANAAFTRLDNIPLNNNFLMRWVKDV